MICAINNKDIKVIAKNVVKKDGPFICPVCKEEVTLKKGRIKTHHFSHKAKSLCAYGRGETEIHRQCKTDLYDALLKVNNIQGVDIEKIIPAINDNDTVSIADVYFEKNNGGNKCKIAIEVQRSSLTEAQILYRTESYAKKDIFVLWLIVPHKKIKPYLDVEKTKFYSPSSHEKWIHTLNYGKIFYYYKGLTVIPVEFMGQDKYVEQTEWGGGYYKTYKNYREVKRYAPTSITRFIPIDRKQWKHIPSAKIYIPEENGLVTMEAFYRNQIQQWSSQQQDNLNKLLGCMSNSIGSLCYDEFKEDSIPNRKIIKIDDEEITINFNDRLHSIGITISHNYKIKKEVLLLPFKEAYSKVPKPVISDFVKGI